MSIEGTVWWRLWPAGVSRSRAEERKSEKIAANAQIAGIAKTAEERLVVSEHESEEENGSYSWLRFRDDLAALLCLPFAISFGLHIAMLAAVLHSRFRIPYYLGLTVLLGLEGCVALQWLEYLPIATAAKLFFAVIGTAMLLELVLKGHSALIDPPNLEQVIPLHSVLIVVMLVANGVCEHRQKAVGPKAVGPKAVGPKAVGQTTREPVQSTHQPQLCIVTPVTRHTLPSQPGRASHRWNTQNEPTAAGMPAMFRWLC